MEDQPILTEDHLLSRIYIIRGMKVMLDTDLAELYAIETKVLNQAVKRNLDRFPGDFMFRLTEKELYSQRSQFVTFENKESYNQQHTKSKIKYSKYLPFAFTEQGVAMLSSILKSKQAIAVNIRIMRIFVKMRHMVMAYKELLAKVEQLETSEIDQDQCIEDIYHITACPLRSS